MQKNRRNTPKHEFRCRTCGEVRVMPQLGTVEDALWRQAWQDEGRVACCECLGVFHHKTVSVLPVERIAEK